MLVTIHDYGSVHGGINWSNPRTDEGEPLITDDWDPKVHEAVCQAVVEQVRAWLKRPQSKSTYEFYVAIQP